MKKTNKIFVTLLASNFILLFCLGILNSNLGNLGFFVYAPILFFMPALLFLDRVRALIILFISGILYDLSNYALLGFHGFFLCFIYLLWQEIFKAGKSGIHSYPTIIQVFINLFLGLNWALFLILFSSGNQTWEWQRLITDLFLSSLVIIPFGIWFPQFCLSLLDFLNLNLSSENAD